MTSPLLESRRTHVRCSPTLMSLEFGSDLKLVRRFAYTHDREDTDVSFLTSCRARFWCPS